MLSLRTPGAALVLALVASMSIAQSGEADPPTAGTIPGTGEPRQTQKPQPVLTLEEKKQLVAFCTQSGNHKDARCKGLAGTSAPDTSPPES